MCLFERVKERERLSQRESFPHSDALSCEPEGTAMLKKNKGGVLLCRVVKFAFYDPWKGSSLKSPQVSLNSLVVPKIHVYKKKNMMNVMSKEGDKRINFNEKQQ